MDSLARLLTQRPLLTIGFVLAVSVLAASRLVDFRTGEVQLEIDPSVERLLPEDDEERLFYDEVRDVFGNDQSILVALHSDALFTPEVLRRVQRLSERLAGLDGVSRVVSLFTALEIRGADDVLHIDPFLEEVPEDPEALRGIVQRVFESPVYAGNLVSRDARATAVIVYLDDMSEEELIRSGLVPAINAVAAEERGDAEVWIAGGAHVKAETRVILGDDLSRVLPLGGVFLALTAILAFRSLRGLIVPLATVGLANLWTLATMVMLGIPLSLVTAVVPALIQTVGFAYATHVVSEFTDRLGKGDQPPAQAAREAVAQLLVPLALTAGTTAIGLLSLAVSRMVAVREFGIMSMIGVIYTAVIAISFAPAVLQIGAKQPRQRRGEDRFDALAERVAHFDLRHRGVIFAASGVLTVIALLGMMRIEVSTDFITNFSPDHPVRRDFEAINTYLDGAGSFSVVIEAEDDEAFKEPKNLRALDDLQRWLEDQPEVGATTSLADYVKVINWGFNDNDPEQKTIPDTRELVSQLLLFGDNEELQLVVDGSFRTANLMGRTFAMNSGEFASLLERLGPRLEELPGDLRARVTGGTVLMARTIDGAAITQAESLSLAFVAIYIMLALLFTSARVGAIALIPNALPVLFYFGVLGWTGIHLNATTGLIACIALGIAVDDTIHYFVRFSQEAHRLGDEREATIRALRRVGKPVTVTSIALCAGFAVLVASQLKNQAEFGVLTAMTLGFAWAADVMLTPALCSRLHIVTLWDTLTLDLGAQPTTTIPLFSGLTTRQARVVCLMANIVHFQPGQRVLRAGDPGDEMYVVIHGELSATLDRSGHEIALSTHRRGDVLGEVALFHGKRTADVRALSEVSALRLTRASLDRLTRRHPRIGAIVSGNLLQVIADRVASQTDRLA